MHDPTDETLASTAQEEPLLRGDVLERGALVGRYVVVAELGRGGMGTVYAAYDPELDRKVALKLLHSGNPPSEERAKANVMNALFGDAKPDSPSPPARSSEQSRLLREAQAAAKINHPNVVTVHDVGEVGGRIFVAMEYIDGPTLGDWAQERRDNWKAILGVLLEAGDGLAMAHAHDLVHRDFKADNVMVDDTGRARVMDFGLVRASGDTGPVGPIAPTENALDLSLTRAGAVIGTPAYMSPEQYAGSGVGPQSDQFSFCVTAWEALYGERPFTADTLIELAVRITEGRRNPPPGDTRVPGHVRQVLERGLTTDASLRYPTMRALLVDLRRDPARRRRWLAAGVGGVALLSGSTVFGRIDDARVAAECRDDAASIDEVWNDARREEVGQGLRATGLPYAETTFTKTVPWLDAYADAWSMARGPACEAARRGEKELGRKALECLDERRAALAGLVRSLSNANPTTTRAAVSNATNLAPIEDCADPVALARLPPLPSDRKEQEAVLAVKRRLTEADILQRAGEVDEAFATIEGLAIRAEALERPVLIGKIQYLTGALHEARGDYAAAEGVLAHSALALAEVGTPRADRHAGDAAMRLALVVADRQSRHEEGMVWGRWAEAMLRRAGLHDGLRGAELHTELGQIATNHGDYQEGLTRYGRALELRKSLLGSTHPLVATSLNNLGSVHSAMGRSDEAAALYDQALEVLETTVGADHPDTALPLNNLAKIHWRRGRFKEAEAAMARSLELQETLLGHDHPQVGVSVGNLGIIVRDAGHPERAVVHHRRAVEILEEKLPATHPKLGSAHHNLGDTLLQLGDVEASKTHLLRALTILEESLGAEHVELANALVSLAHTQAEERDLDGALESLARARPIYEKAVEEENPDLGMALLETGRVEMLADRAEEAVVHLRGALEILDAVSASESERASVRYHLATALFVEHPDSPEGLELLADAAALLSRAENASPQLQEKIEALLEKHRPLAPGGP